MVDIALTDNADVYITFLTTKDTPDNDLETDGTNIAEVYSGARITDINLKIILHAGASGDRTEIMMFRDKDATLLTNATIGNLFEMDYAATPALVRAAAMWYDMHIWGSGSDKLTTAPRIRRAAMARNSQLRENDTLRILFSQNDGGTGRKVSIVGRITTVA